MWWIIDLVGDELVSRAIPGVGRPEDARPAYGDPFRPWYQEVEHVHTGPDDTVGAHVYADTLAEAVVRARALLGRE